MITRRNLLAGIGAGILAPRLTFGAKAKFTLGIGTYTFRSITMEQLIEDMQSLRLRHIELSTPGYMLRDVTLEKARDLRVKLDKGGIVVPSFYCGEIKTQDDLDLTVQVAKELGANNVSGSAVGEALQWIDQRFQREKLTFGIHNHFFHGRKFEYESPEDVQKAIQNLSNTVGATVDAGHMVSCGFDPVEALRKLRPRLKVVHLKDVEGPGDDKNVVLGTGAAKSAEVIKTLIETDFRGLVAIEYEADNPREAVPRCVDFARQHMGAMA